MDAESNAGTAKFKLKINRQEREVNVDGEMPLLWVLRDELGLTGTKFGCGKGFCGSCTVHVDGAAVRSCSFPVSGAVGHEITTIEGLSEQASHPVQQAWIDGDVPQCGYCQSGQIMAAAALLKAKPKVSDVEIEQTMSNLCRCGTYNRIRTAIKSAAANPGLAKKKGARA